MQKSNGIHHDPFFFFHAFVSYAEGVFMISYTNNDCSNCIRLAEQNEQYHNLISQISHEVRNPLTLIYSSLQLIEKECPLVTETALWPQVREDIQDTIRLLKDISVLNRSTRSAKESFSVFDLLHGVSVSFHALMQEKHISFDTELAPQLQDCTLFGDPILLKEALWNLLLNAADAVASHINNSQISLTAAICDSQIQIHVRDNGIGIPDEYLPTLFDPFVTHKSGGTGLGLCIAKSAALQHGGTLTVANISEQKFCTDFCLMLPAAKSKTPLQTTAEQKC